MSLMATPIKSLLSKLPLRQGEALEMEVKHHHPAHPPGPAQTAAGRTLISDFPNRQHSRITLLPALR